MPIPISRPTSHGPLPSAPLFIAVNPFDAPPRRWRRSHTAQSRIVAEPTRAERATREQAEYAAWEEAEAAREQAKEAEEREAMEQEQAAREQAEAEDRVWWAQAEAREREAMEAAQGLGGAWEETESQEQVVVGDAGDGYSMHSISTSLPVLAESVRDVASTAASVGEAASLLATSVGDAASLLAAASVEDAASLLAPSEEAASLLAEQAALAQAALEQAALEQAVREQGASHRTRTPSPTRPSNTGWSLSASSPPPPKPNSPEKHIDGTTSVIFPLPHQSASVVAESKVHPLSSFQDSMPLPATSSRPRVTLEALILNMAVYLLNATSYLYDFIPRQIYEHCLLRIPRLYFLRVTRTFEDLQLTRRDITRMADARADEWDSSANHNLSPGLLRFRSSWEDLIDSLMREWKTLNIISVLLMSTILSMLQIDAASHPITRTTALFSLICALMSLLYGCMYIVRFGRMRKMHKANRFAEEARKTKTKIWWNVWVVLAMPAVWLAWSIITFLTCIMSFIWLGAFSNDLVHSDVSPRVVLGLRIALTAVFSIGVFCFFLIIRTFQRFRDE